MPLNVKDPQSVATLADTLKDRPLDVLVCNAGLYIDTGHSLDHGDPVEMRAEEFAVNVTGLFLTVQPCLPAVRAARGKIAILSSQMAFHTQAPGGAYIYRASKAAALNLGRTLASDLRSDGISVGIYHPGWVQTDMGGASAQIIPAMSAQGLVDRFEELALASTGFFLTWDGHQPPY